ncbi:MAG: class I SAM-dependent methyltransferase [Deltaproteobacteria bacterium]|nr:class I SAM-dependent methyltransferase [Deltaproteobacteria bacterium]
MSEVIDKIRIRKVFRDVQKHLAIAQLIRRFSTNKEDIRKTALKQIDLTNCQNVLELGCAFGAFTEALKDKLHPEAKITGIDIIPEYKPFFLEACRRAGYSGIFSSSGIDKIKKYPASSFDLVICSYALYFFADMIPEIARILNKNGFFITITHSQADMREMVGIVRKILQNNNSLSDKQSLPIEVIFNQFSAENGGILLQPFFSKVQSIDFKNMLVFQPQEIDCFLDYFQFKKSFFLTGTDAHNKTIITQLMRELQDSAMKKNLVTMCKDDKIFICSNPLKTEDK